MTMNHWANDDDLMRALGDAVSETRAVPDTARTAARAAFSWRTVDGELLALSYDSMLHEDALVRRADGAQVRTASFQGDGVTLEVEIDDGNLLGQLVPGQACRVTLESLDGSVLDAEADESGFFSFPKLATGRSVRFRLETADTAMTTDWLAV
jgi:hypothetical protein